ncbi:MAG: RNA methyltransferase [Spirochaetales bacterium]|jgi:TrmH family RNA methyltransferase
MTLADMAASQRAERGGGIARLYMEQMRDISVVLCRVRESGNVGSICRAMKTMGLAQLLLADCPEYSEEKVRMMAVHAFDVFEKAERCDTLAAALDGFPFTAGFTRRQGEKRKNSSESLREFANRMALRSPSPFAIVFGNEKDGLSDEELNLCSVAVHIPTSESCPSLNVAQAVQVACYEFFEAEKERSLLARTGAAASTRLASAAPAPRATIEREISTIAEILAKAGFFKKSDDSHMKRFLRDLCERAGASSDEIQYLRKLFLKSVALSSGPSPRRRDRT